MSDTTLRRSNRIGKYSALYHFSIGSKYKDAIKRLIASREMSGTGDEQYILSVDEEIFIHLDYAIKRLLQ